MDVQYRSAALKDVQAIREVGIATWWATYSGLLAPQAIAAVLRRGWRDEVIRGQINHDAYHVLVAEVEEEVTGVLFARLPQVQAPAMIERLYVRPDAQGHGLGYGLWRTLVERLPQAVQAVELDVLASNAKAIAFYQRIGFVEASRFVESVAGFPMHLIYMRASRPFV
ncbi:GNAT family N-acetyltransferase [Aggregatilineales bacterium SYSU G02658]